MILLIVINDEPVGRPLALKVSAKPLDKSTSIKKFDALLSATAPSTVGVVASFTVDR